MFENIFNSRKVYANGYEEVESRNFNAEEQAAVASATVVTSNYGTSCCFMMRGGGKTYIPMSRDSKLCVGDKVDLSTAKIIHLHRDGGDPETDDILRVIEG
jgi:hypothetical protein